MLRQLRVSLVMLAALTVLTGIVYPAVVTAIANVAFAHRAGGSILREGGKPIGSELIGQPFSKLGYFWGRLSATSPVPYNAAASSGSNFGPLNPALRKAAETRLALLRRYPTATSAVPVDLVTASASGLDPHISPAAAEYQVPRVAAARKMSPDAVRKLVRQYTADRQYGRLGEPRVNVLRLNLALDRFQAVNVGGQHGDETTQPR
ncbi:MAG: potassium-transporting ATPase subunit KdpC [Thermoguttaceae bacterium]